MCPWNFIKGHLNILCIVGGVKWAVTEMILTSTYHKFLPHWSLKDEGGVSLSTRFSHYAFDS